MVQVARNNLNINVRRKEELVLFIQIVTNKMVKMSLITKALTTNRYKVINWCFKRLNLQARKIIFSKLLARFL